MSKRSLLFLGILLGSFLLLKIGLLFAYDITSLNLTDYSNYINKIVPSIKLIKEDRSVKIIMEVNIPETIPETIKNSIKINSFEIYRNNTLITETKENQYEDKNLEPGIYDYKYTAHLTMSLGNFTTSTRVYSPVTSTTIYAPSTPLAPTTVTPTTKATKEEELPVAIPIKEEEAVKKKELPVATPTKEEERVEKEITPEEKEILRKAKELKKEITPEKEIAPEEKEILRKAKELKKEITPEKERESKKETTTTPEFLKIKISGKTLTSDGNILGESKVFIKTEKDGFFEIETKDNGEFSLEVSNLQNISLTSVKEKDSAIYRSKIINISLENNDQNINIYLEKEDKKIPSPIEKKVEIIKEEKILLEDKAEITIPPTFVTTTNVVNVSVKATVDLPPITNFSLVSPAYEIKITDEQNKEIKSFEKEIQIKIPYNPDELKSKGLTEDQILLGYFDEDKKVWSTVEKFSIDKTNKVVIGYVKHLTKFAIISFADTTPPPPPSNPKRTLTKNKQVKISWVNPKEDFKYVRIYRSSNKNTWGNLLFKEVTSTEIIDKNVKWGETYYYLIKSVDAAGNESANTEPLTINLFKFSRYLKLGSRGNDVKKLQEILIKENVYPEKIVSGYFGPATKRAVIKFQEKYSKEILKPANLKKGTGFVGPNTLKKLNQLLNEI